MESFINIEFSVHEILLFNFRNVNNQISEKVFQRRLFLLFGKCSKEFLQAENMVFTCLNYKIYLVFLITLKVAYLRIIYYILIINYLVVS